MPAALLINWKRNCGGALARLILTTTPWTCGPSKTGRGCDAGGGPGELALRARNKFADEYP